MKKTHKDTECLVDTIGINLNSHLNFGIIKPNAQLISIIEHQSSPEDVLDNLEKKA